MLEQDGEGALGHPAGGVREHGRQQRVHPALAVPEQPQAMQQGEDQGGVPLLVDERVALQQLAELLLGRETALEHPDPAHAAQQHRGQGQGEPVGLGRDQDHPGIGLEREGILPEIRQGVGHPPRHPPDVAIRKDQAELGQALAGLGVGLHSGLGELLERPQPAAVQIQERVAEALVVLEVEHHGLEQPHAALGALFPMLWQGQFAPFTDLPQLLIRAISQ